jgi:hypothetical protein
MTQPMTVPPPGCGLNGNSNYFLADNCNAITGLSVTIDVEEDIVWQASSPDSVRGFGFQLNAYSPMYHKSGYQQYVIFLVGSDLQSGVNNYTVAGQSIFFHVAGLTSVPKALTLPAGYQLGITLRNNSWRTTWDLAVAGGWGGPPAPPPVTLPS